MRATSCRQPRRHPLVVAGLFCACALPEQERIHCDDILGPEQASFSQLKLLVTNSGGNDKGCSASSCHGSDDAEHGYRFDEDSAIYDALTTHIDSVYAQVASGEMPPEGGAPWNEEDLRLLRSWYCNGAFPNE